MEARVHRPVDRDVVQVFLFEDRSDGRWQRVIGDHRYDLIRIPAEAAMQPTIEFRPEDFAALIRAGMEFEPPSSAQARHLDDAIKVRDRLLTLVEQS